MEVASPGLPNGLAVPNPVPTADPNSVVQYLRDALQVTLGASRRDLERPGSLLSKPKYSETVQRCTRFASESQIALYVQKDMLSPDQPKGAEDGECENSRRATSRKKAKTI
jgi:dynein heavy chain 1